MAETLQAVYTEGGFKLLDNDSLPFYEGQRVSLTVEGAHWKKDDFLSKYSVDWINSPSQPPEKTNFDTLLEAVNVPRPLWDKVVDGYEDMKDFVLNRERPESENLPQKKIRAGLAIFSNVSTLFIYLVLIGIVLKFIGIWLLRTRNATDLISGLGGSLFLIPVLIILVCLTSVNVLLRISKFIKSYRIMSIIGLWAVLHSLGKTAVLLITAKSLSGMWTTLWQFASGSFK